MKKCLIAGLVVVVLIFAVWGGHLEHQTVVFPCPITWEYNESRAHENLNLLQALIPDRVLRIPENAFYAGVAFNRERNLTLYITEPALALLSPEEAQHWEEVRAFAYDPSRHITVVYVQYSMRDLRTMQNYIVQIHGMGSNATNTALQNTTSIGVSVGGNRVFVTVVGLHWFQARAFRQEVTDSSMVELVRERRR